MGKKQKFRVLCSFWLTGLDRGGFFFFARLKFSSAMMPHYQDFGAKILGLSKHNYNMFLKFAQNLSKEKDCFYSIGKTACSFKLSFFDYENDKDFWYKFSFQF